MASADQADGSEDVTDFLRRIKELGDKRDREDAERTRKLEDDIIEGRKHREARRAERARSLSPDKSSPSTTPLSMRSPRTLTRSDFASSPLNASATPNFPPTIGSVIEEPAGKSEFFPMTNQMHPPSRSSTNVDDRTLDKLESPANTFQFSSSTPTRSATLSWQQRPSSHLGSRALHLEDRNAGSSPSFPASHNPLAQNEEEPALSRYQIAQSLGSKDPSWFRQTEDRGIGSVASRRSIRDTDQESLQAEKKALPGISRESSLGAGHEQTPPLSAKAASTTQRSSVGRNVAQDDTTYATFPISFDVSGNGHNRPEDNLRMPERPDSPVRGSGGYAQSALLKRSESINKRWSAQIPPDLNRHNSNTSGYEHVANGNLPSSVSMPKLGDDSQDSTAEQKSRPSSSHSKIASQQGNDVFARPSLPQHKHSQSSISLRTSAQGKVTDGASPSSPSKRRSPQKASWLESALNRPESPTPNSPTPKSGPSQQPAWMVELNRAKQQRVTRDIFEPTLGKSESSPVEVGSSSIKEVPMKPQKPASPPSTKPKPAILMESPQLNSTRSSGESMNVFATVTPINSKPKPEAPPKKDFRSQLRSSNAPQDKGESQEPEFLDAFGKLRRTQTEKYVAPDELKSNILRGKSALTMTDGPQRTQRRDELKDSLVQQRETMKAKTIDPTPRQQQNPRAPVDIPEAIAKKQALSRNESSGNIMSAPKGVKDNNQNSINEKEEQAALHSPPSSAVADDKSPPKSNATFPNNTFANKFNPQMFANVLTRGHPSSATAKLSPTATRGIPSKDSSGKQVQTSESNNQGAQLQHMTKGRARGPKRRLPKAGLSTAQTESSTQATAAPSYKPLPPVKPQNITSHLPTPPAGNALPEPQPDNVSKPLPPFKSPQLGIGRESPSVSDPTSPSKGSLISHHTLLKNSAPLNRPPMSKESPRQQTAQEGMRALNEEEGMNRLKEISAGLVGPSSSFQTSKFKTEMPKGHPSPTIGSSVAPKPRPDVLSRNPNVPFKGLPKPLPKIPSSPSKPAPGRMLAGYFDETIVAPTKLDVDCSIILQSNPETLGSKTKTVKKEISELGNDGKTTLVPSHQEHLLYDNQMYLCTRVFESTKGSRAAEVYLWAGSAVAAAAVEDAQLFARRAAKDVGGKLVIVRQGLETGNFMQALGGILISRSGSTRDSSSSYMLCGRQHLGHLAFDEVELSASSLCSGFPYIIVAGREKVFLWRGSGCNSEELAGARLISMDVGPSGVVTEVEEGREPPDLMKILMAPVPRSADHWKLKTNFDNYRSRLFNVEFNERPISRQDSGPAALWNLVRRRSQADFASSSGTQIVEVIPFAQSDLQAENIYVLDAFFEIYVIRGSAARSKSRAFASALLFAQEYAVLAASSENRPYIPVATVVLEGAPRDLKRVFRRWDDSLMPTSKTVDSVKRGKSLKVIPLAQALDALKSEV